MTTDHSTRSELEPPTLGDAPGEPGTLGSVRAPGRFTSEVMAGGSVTELADDELVGGWRGALGVLGVIAVIGVLGLFSIWWLVFAVGVLVMMFLHELGHFSTARLTGMKATQFFIGFGPRLWSFRRGETEYGVRALPLGAFVRIVGMNNMDEVEAADEPRSYRSKSYPRRLLVISAGSLMHMVLAIALLFVVYVGDGEVASTSTDHAQVQQLVAGAPAAAAGLQVDDVVLAIDGTPVADPADIGAAVQSRAAGDTIVFTVARGATRTDLADATTLDIPLVLAANDDPTSELFGKPFIGISSGSAYVTVDHSVPGAAANAVTDIFPASWETMKATVQVLNPVNIVTHVAGTNEDLATRPTTLVGVTSVTDDVGREEGIYGLLYLLAILNVFIGVFNMLPLLPLDGGHAAIATYERIREFGRRGQRYHADVAKLMPFAMAVVSVLALLFMAGLYLDVAKPIG